MTEVESPRPRFWGKDQIVSQHLLWSSNAAEDYVGARNDLFSPGNIDPKRILIIGEADEDSPLVLDFRTEVPRVIYLGSSGPHSFWIEIASSYEQLCGLLRGET